MRLLFRIALIAVGCAVGVSTLAQKPALAQLYPAAPPEGASFVPLVNPSQFVCDRRGCQAGAHGETRCC